jgi:hypothetical protein
MAPHIERYLTLKQALGGNMTESAGYWCTSISL